jgi:hypothetical protein
MQFSPADVHPPASRVGISQQQADLKSQKAKE